MLYKIPLIAMVNGVKTVVLTCKQKSPRNLLITRGFLVHPTRFERVTHGFGDKRTYSVYANLCVKEYTKCTPKAG